ncbi:MAG: deoxyribodipyrimidine photo-lyase, partial [Planctomycetota bacterium]
MRALHWFRSDLRIRDNTALHAACRQATDGVVGVFTICPDQWREHDWGAPKVDFILRNLAELKDALAGRNIALKIIQTLTFDKVPDALLKVAQDAGCRSLWFNREYEWNEMQRDDAVASLFHEKGFGVHEHTDKVVFAPGEVLTKQDKWYSVYSPFKKNWLSQHKDGNAPETLGICKKQPEIDVSSDDVPESLDGFDIAQEAVRPDLWTAGESHAQNRLKAFIDARVDDYKDQRDYPGVNGTSTLSPYLALGLVSPRQCVEAARESNNGRVDTGSTGVVGWIEELIWRDFYQHVLV